MNKNTKSNSIRIIAGQWRGRRIPVLDQSGLRPTTDRVRETLFNWLMHDIREARCLDVYAGTGALGFESLSRGAEYVQFIESNGLVVNAIQKNIGLLFSNEIIDNLKLNKAVVTQANALDILAKENRIAFDIVFLDPPFNKNLVEPTAALLEKNSFLRKSAWIYIECEAQKQNLRLPSNWELHKQGEIGQSTFFLYKR